MPTTHIFFVGNQEERLIESISALREIPLSKLFLIVGDDTSNSGKQAISNISRQIPSEMKVMWEIEIHAIDSQSVLNATSQLFRIITEEKIKGNEVFLNTSGSPHTLSIGAYIAACMTQSRMLTSIQKYNEEGKEVGIGDVIEIPILPVSYPRDEQREIITHIGEGVESLDSIIFMINPGIRKESREFRSERSRLSHHLTKLEEAGFIRKEKHGRNISIRLTELGRMLAGLIDSKLI
ncbi:MAG: transcriptional regulator [Methanocalculus sp. MSAO_Arc1]|uniref:HFX_2341 family transcriptional regulator domain-containing protein n=1 Tax=Methanocalculus TaxID=71151 RepID=UPI000FEF03E7|nr:MULTISPECIES: DUF6293 family protein [unclassified Methanocalculus]MCP1663186.1 CRISPR-associated protein Csa3 [Methanocalculus sp. AMF5]RQD80422.1 MAG: transcriptional regulator [Methanocalculus sp. MSAO_Arc1]